MSYSNSSKKRQKSYHNPEQLKFNFDFGSEPPRVTFFEPTSNSQSLVKKDSLFKRYWHLLFLLTLLVPSEEHLATSETSSEKLRKCISLGITKGKEGSAARIGRVKAICTAKVFRGELKKEATNYIAEEIAKSAVNGFRRIP